MASSAESLIYSDPRSSLTVFGTFGEQLTKEIMHLDDLGDWELNQKQRIEKMAYSKNEYPPTVLNALNLIRLRRNKSAHDDHFIATKKIALEIDQSAYLVWKWFLEVYSLDEVADYVKESNSNYVRYRVTPVFRGNELLARGVEMEGQSVKSNSVHFNVYIFNVQEGVSLNYATGTSKVE